MSKALNRYEEFGKILDTLSSRNMEEDVYYNQYVLSPYMQGLGYDVFDIDETERMFDGNTYKVKGVEDELGEDIFFIFSLDDYRERVEEDNVRAYVLFDKDTKSVTLYYYVLDEWYSIYETRLQMDGTEDMEIERSNLVSLNKVITKSEFQKSYELLGERLFTGSVVDSLLENGDLENRFVRQALVDELTKPDSYMITMLASKLTEYSTQEDSWIEDKLEGIKETGLITLLESAISNDEIEVIVRPKSQPLPSARVSRPKKQSEVSTDISHKADKLKEAGFSTDNLGKASKEEPVKEEPVEEKKEDEFKIGDLRDQLTSREEKEEDVKEPKPEPNKKSEDGMTDIANFFDE